MSAGAIVIICLAVLGYAAVSRRLSRTPLTGAMVFVTVGFLLGSDGLGWLSSEVSASALEAVTDATLVAVLFADASKLDVASLRRDHVVPLRLLLVGLPLTIAVGAAVAWGLLPALRGAEALVLAVVLAPTDAALGQAVVVDRRLPQRVRQGLNTESGLNDGICVPLLAVALAFVEASTDQPHVLSSLASEVGLGVLAGAVAGMLGVAVTRWTVRLGWIEPVWRPAVALAAAGLAYGLAVVLDASGFIAAFVAGLTYAARLGGTAAEEVELVEEAGSLLTAVTFMLFGAVVIGPLLAGVDPADVLYALASLTLVRMLPVALALLGTGLRRPTVALIGWFGPRGLASIVFGLVAVEQVDMPHSEQLLRVASLTIVLSIVLHGVSALPLVDRYTRWLARSGEGAEGRA